MINLIKLIIYERYKGNPDPFARFGTLEEKGLISSEDWRVIESLIQDIKLTANNLASESFQEETLNKIQKVCADLHTQIALEQLAKTL